MKSHYNDYWTKFRLDATQSKKTRPPPTFTCGIMIPTTTRKQCTNATTPIPSRRGLCCGLHGFHRRRIHLHRPRGLRDVHDRLESRRHDRRRRRGLRLRLGRRGRGCGCGSGCGCAALVAGGSANGGADGGRAYLGGGCGGLRGRGGGFLFGGGECGGGGSGGRECGGGGGGVGCGYGNILGLFGLVFLSGFSRGEHGAAAAVALAVDLSLTGLLVLVHGLPALALPLAMRRALGLALLPRHLLPAALLPHAVPVADLADLAVAERRAARALALAVRGLCGLALLLGQRLAALTLALLVGRALRGAGRGRHARAALALALPLALAVDLLVGAGAGAGGERLGGGEGLGGGRGRGGVGGGRGFEQ
mmetsp:Transcript_7337/g.19179  ORF Transcript_7337/g.19179 Transcript_7337/m.19179 type:complete len:364 (+) Transcript_7337:72-1163(+)